MLSILINYAVLEAVSVVANAGHPNDLAHTAFRHKGNQINGKYTYHHKICNTNDRHDYHRNTAGDKVILRW